MNHRPRSRRQLMEFLEPRQLMSVVAASSANAPEFSVADVTVKEGKAATLTVTLAEASDRAVTVKYGTSDQTPYYQAATAGADYAAKRGALTFRPGETKKTIRVPVRGDKVAESEETFRMNLSYGGSVVAGGAVTIQDDDRDSSKGLPVLSIADTTVMEGDEGSVVGVTVTLSKAAEKDVTFRYSYPGSDKNKLAISAYPPDYVPAAGTLTIPAGQTSATVLISLVGDTSYEPNQSFAVRLSNVKNARAINGRPEVSSAVTVVDDEPLLFTDDAGTVVAGISGVLRSDDVYVSNYTLDNSITIPVIHSTTTLVSANTSTIARFDPQYLTAAGTNTYVFDTGAALNLMDRSVAGSTYIASGTLNLSGSNGLVLQGSSTSSLSEISLGAVSVSGTTRVSSIANSATLYIPPFTNYGSSSGVLTIPTGATSTNNGTVVVNSGSAGGTISIASSLFGDANLDGRVDENDLAIIERSMADPSTPVSWSTGDFNGDQVINADDLAILDRNLAL